MSSAHVTQRSLSVYDCLGQAHNETCIIKTDKTKGCCPLSNRGAGEDLTLAVVFAGCGQVATVASLINGKQQ